jgi:hypothetical protein
LRVANLEHKDVLLSMDPEVFFTEPHDDGYPAILIHLAAIDRSRLGQLLRDAWACQAPKSLWSGPPVKKAARRRSRR